MMNNGDKVSHDILTEEKADLITIVENAYNDTDELKSLSQASYFSSLPSANLFGLVLAINQLC